MLLKIPVAAVVVTAAAAAAAVAAATVVAAVPVSCTMLYVPAVVFKPKFRSSQKVPNQFIVAIASMQIAPTLVADTRPTIEYFENGSMLRHTTVFAFRQIKTASEL
jgi:hypothetical protein